MVEIEEEIFNLCISKGALISCGSWFAAERPRTDQHLFPCNVRGGDSGEYDRGNPTGWGGDQRELSLGQIIIREHMRCYPQARCYCRTQPVAVCHIRLREGEAVWSVLETHKAVFKRR